MKQKRCECGGGEGRGGKRRQLGRKVRRQKMGGTMGKFLPPWFAVHLLLRNRLYS